MLKIVASWFISPLLSALLCSFLLIIVTAVTLGGLNFSLKIKLACLSVIYAVCFGLTNFMFIRLVQEKEDVPGAEYLTILISSISGFITCRIYVGQKVLKTGWRENSLLALRFWDFASYENRFYSDQEPTL